MDNAEFLHHMNIIKDLMKNSLVRIILVHPPYNSSQQKIIDSISRQSRHIIGQIERNLPAIDVAKEVQRLVMADKEPFVSKDKIQYVILGQQKP